MAVSPRDKKVAIVHDWLVGGGAERVVQELHRMFPEAPIYTSYCTPEWRRKLDNTVVTGYLQHWPFSRLRRFLPVLQIKWFESLDLSAYDLVISSSGNGNAKAVKAGSRFHDGQLHVCYCHTPVHYYWRHYDLYLRNPGFGIFDSLARIGLRTLVNPLRRKDIVAAERPDYYIANSTHIQADIKRYYNRASTVIFPPVDTARFTIADSQPVIPVAHEGISPADNAAADGTTERRGFVTVGRQVPQKHTDIIIQACTRLGLPLTVIGKGPEHDRLIKMAGSSVTFVTTASDEEVVRHLRSAEGFIFAALDDFGITPVEAMAAGTPVIAFRGGGALDYVQPAVTGEFFDLQTAEALTEALSIFEIADYNPSVIRKAAERFTADTFAKRLTGMLTAIRPGSKTGSEHHL